MRYTEKELDGLTLEYHKARRELVNLSKRYRIIKKVYFSIEAEYNNLLRAYNKIDREYTMAIFEKNQKRKIQQTKPYNSAEQTAKKALKALENLPKELRDKIIQQAKDGLF